MADVTKKLALIGTGLLLAVALNSSLNLYDAWQHEKRAKEAVPVISVPAVQAVTPYGTANLGLIRAPHGYICVVNMSSGHLFCYKPGVST